MKPCACILQIFLSFAFFSVIAAAPISSPADHFGFSPGTDGKLISYGELLDYLVQLDEASDWIRMQDTGTSPMGRPMKLLFLSSPENLARLDELKDINKRLAIKPLESDALDADVSAGRVFVMLTLSMHSTEVAPSQALPELAWRVATRADPDISGWLSDVVLMIVPCHNPDGMDMVVEHYRTYFGTRYEGSMLPGVYHKYVGHDNNRDFVTLTQSDTRAIADAYSTQWYPQVLVEKHQMGSTGPRYFVPENHDPIAENVDEEMWTWLDVFGANLSKDMTADGCSGVASHWAFDNYWPGSTETSLWKNVISLLTEAASCKVATPVYIEPQELRVRGKGLSEYKKSVNMPDPWPGGWWRLSDIVRYELSSVRSILRTASMYRADILRFRNHMCMKEIKKGQEESPAAFVIPVKQHDPGERDAMVDLLIRHGISVYRAKDAVESDGHRISTGDLVVPLAQPYRAFIKEVMETQSYPVRHYTPDGDIIRPYDIASWSLPSHRGLYTYTIDSPDPALTALLEPVQAPYRPGNEPRYKAGYVILPAAWNASYSLVFHGLQEGISVDRLTAEGTVSGGSVHAGDFVVYTHGKKASVLDRLVQQLPAPPVIVQQAPDIPARKLKMPRIGLVETWFHDMDAGWTRYVLDETGIAYTVIRPGDFAQLKLEDFDVLVFPDERADILRKGSFKRGDDYYVPDMPAEYRKGIGDDGMLKIVSFINDGGIILSWGQSTDLFTGTLKEQVSEKETESFNLPVQDIGDQVRKDGLYVPGSLLRVDLRQDHPITLGLEKSCNVFSRGTPVFRTSPPRLDMDRRILAVYPETDILVSGYAEKVEALADQAAGVWLKKGKGQLVLFAFSPQFRASTSGVYKLMFNTFLLN